MTVHAQYLKRRMIHKMPRSLPFSNRSRLVAIALVFVASLCLAGLRAGAQRARPAQTGNTNTAAAAQNKSITPLRASETPDGSRITITSDGALNDYSAYRSGDRFYVEIPSAEAPRLLSNLRGRGFDDVRVQKRGNNVILSFRLLAGAAARVNQKFNRLEIIITVPALAAANNAANNANARPQPSPANVTGNTSVANSNRRPQTGIVTPPVNNNTANPTGVTPPNNISTTNPNTVTTNPNTSTNPNTATTRNPRRAGRQPTARHKRISARH
jgi:hypothetical protein